MLKKDKLKNITEANLKLQETWSLNQTNVVNEDDIKADKVKVQGVDTEDPTVAAGKADFLVKSVKGRLRSMALSVDDADKQKTIAQLKVAPFGFKFSLIWPKSNEWGEKDIVTLSINNKEISASRIETRAKVKSDNPELIIETKLGLSIKFIDSKELNQTLGNDFKLPPGEELENFRRLLQEGFTYKVKINTPIIVGGEGGDDTEGVSIPEEIASGENRNEIFRLLLKNFGGYDGSVVYGDGFKNAEKAKEYGRLQRAVKNGKKDKKELAKFRKNSKRDSYSMLVSNLRKSFPNTFISKLSKAFPEFNIKSSRNDVDESLIGFDKILNEEENKDKYKRWDIVFPGKVVGSGTIDNLDKNIKEFMAAVKKWFAVPVVGNDGKKRSYGIDYDSKMVDKYWSQFYGDKKESTLKVYDILLEILKEEKTITPETENFPEYLLLRIESGGLVTADESSEEVEARVYGKNKGQFIDAIIINAGREFDKGENKIKGNFKVKPGFANSGGSFGNKQNKVTLNIKYSGDKIDKNSTIEIEGLDDINNMLTQVIKAGNMKIKKSEKDGDYIIIYYPSQIEIAKRINNTWIQK
jgi:hypothetical protein